ncbi:MULTISPECIES: alpha/beta fold hydrolase [Nocardia]|uniref:alpha/beta fold hydrolase n=1 Tax=Nocardia abscessus TaxID=120957 RepID=UPI001E4818FA|nr:alpha/beta hydrolase [Nocardia abscessus]
MGESTETGVLRTAVQVDGETASYLTAGQDGPTVLLLHGTYWSRVWLPVLGRLAEAGLRPVAVDFPGLGRSGGELTLETATVPALAEWVARFASALEISGPIAVAGHGIGGAVAQHLLAHDHGVEVARRTCGQGSADQIAQPPAAAVDWANSAKVRGGRPRARCTPSETCSSFPSLSGSTTSAKAAASAGGIPCRTSSAT